MSFAVMCHNCRDLLHSTQLDVSYFAAGVVSHLLADDSTRHMLSATLVQQLHDELVLVVTSSVKHLIERLPIGLLSIIMSLSRCSSWTKLNLPYTEINNIMYADKTLYNNGGNVMMLSTL